MLNDFLPIPDAPNYEINSQLICRNCKTKHVMTLHTDRKNFKYYSLRPPGWKHTLKRSPKTLHNQAVDAANPNNTFQPIPSTGFRYEIDERGVIRNAKSKQVLKLKARGKCVELHVGVGKYIMACVADLLWEVHGRIIKRRFRPCPCSAENKHGKHFFPSLTACACFLAPKLFYCVDWIKSHLCRRVSTIGEWKITYINETLDDIKWNSHSLSVIARHQAKLDAQGGLSS